MAIERALGFGESLGRRMGGNRSWYRRSSCFEIVDVGVRRDVGCGSFISLLLWFALACFRFAFALLSLGFDLLSLGFASFC